MAVEDINGDGIPDLIVANYNSKTVSVFLGNGNGTFQAARSYDSGAGASSVAVGDLNGDGAPDLAVASGTYPDGTVAILLGNGDGTFQSAQSYSVVNPLLEKIRRNIFEPPGSAICSGEYSQHAPMRVRALPGNS